MSVPGPAIYIRPYLLRGLKVERPNQVWSIDITYIPMRKGFLYLTAIIDVYSRFIVGWSLHNTLDASNCIGVFRAAVARYGAPEIINSDQGCQFTSGDWTEACRQCEGMRVSMDGRGRAKDNIWIERFKARPFSHCSSEIQVNLIFHSDKRSIWKTIKYEYIYIHPEEDGLALYNGIRRFVNDYNYHRRHQGIDHRVPSKLYLRSAA